MRFSLRILLLFASIAIAAIFVTLAAHRFTAELPLHPLVIATFAGLVMTPAVLWASRIVARRIVELNEDLGNALRASRDGDYSLRLVVRGDRELAELRSLYNELADAVRESRSHIQNKEILLDTVLQRSPIAVLLLNAAERVIYSNPAARDLFADGARVDGRALADLVEPLERSLREVLAAGADTLFHHGDETFHITHREFRLHTQRHRLILVERLTPELRRQEVTVWKKAIRIINHEVNNSVAPISSLFHSARRAQDAPEHRHRLEEIYALIEERLHYLRGFLESYARFARLPEPRRERIRWREILEGVRSLYDFRMEADPEGEAFADPGQMQQLLINLVKNAHESGSDPSGIAVSIVRHGDHDVMQVIDRGPGMTDEAMRNALIPFHTTKPRGSGLGLALCNEIVEAHGGRLRLGRRTEGGTVVSCWLPVRAGEPGGSIAGP